MNMQPTKATWISISPGLSSASEREEFARHVRALSKVPPFDHLTARIESVQRVREQLLDSRKGYSAILKSAGLVLSDFVEQGWSCRNHRGQIQMSRPSENYLDRDRVREQLHVQRDRYLNTVPVREFVNSMERRRYHRGKWVSIFSLMRDGAELAQLIAGRERDLTELIRPYIQVVTPDIACEHTGLKLLDIWRYFRCTWANRYQSVPGRSLMILIRDGAVPNHPVIGISALGSSAVQINIRDKWIGWIPEQCVADLRTSATDADVAWLLRLVNTGLAELYQDDLFDQSLSSITLTEAQRSPSHAIAALRKLARDEKHKHFRLVNAGDHKSPELEKLNSGERWLKQAESPLFRSKRADLLAMLLRAKAVLVNGAGPVRAERFRNQLASPDVRQAVQSLILRAKSERVGVAVADITICGAIAPYSTILGGKLVAMLTVSPEAVMAYRERYSKYESVIASSLAAKPVVRSPHLVFLGTTSLYGVEPTQYTRLQIPCERVGGKAGESLRYSLLGSTRGFGTFHFSDETVAALATALSQTTRGQRVNSIFGEGTSPRLRKIRDGLDLLNLPSDELLLHGSSRLVYGVSLVRNLKDYLLGRDLEPDYLIPMHDPKPATTKISEWWVERWLRPRVARPDIIEQMKSDRLTYPIRHRARVALPESTYQGNLPLEA